MDAAAGSSRSHWAGSQSAVQAPRTRVATTAVATEATRRVPRPARTDGVSLMLDELDVLGVRCMRASPAVRCRMLRRARGRAGSRSGGDLPGIEQAFDYAGTVSEMQGSLFGAGDLELRVDQATHRTRLDAHCWVDQVHGWLGGQLELYDRLARADIWHHAERPMYGRMVAEPRLSAGMRVDGPRTPAIVRRMATDLSRRYGVGMGGIWCNWYRDGDDAVAWHADRIGRAHKDPPVAIVSLGSTRRFLLRPKGGGSSVPFAPAGGDLLVMGGACQHHWEHCVPRDRRGGPRISVTFRPAVRRDDHREDWAPGRVVRPPAHSER